MAPRRVSAIVCTLAFLGAFLALTAHADSITLNPSADATVYSANPNNANSKSSYLWIGDDSTSGKRFSLLKFNLDAIPATSTINSVTLRLTVTDTGFDQMTIDVYTVSSDWNEGPTNPILDNNGEAASAGDPTWAYASYDTRAWISNSGPDSSGSSVVSFAALTGDARTIGNGLVPVVSGWLAVPGTNYGLLLKSGTPGVSRQFGSLQNSFDTTRPALIIDYTPPSGTSTTPQAKVPATAGAPRVVIDFTAPPPGYTPAMIASANSGLGAGAIAGIVIGCVSLLIAIVRVVIIFL